MFESGLVRSIARLVAERWARATVLLCTTANQPSFPVRSLLMGISAFPPRAARLLVGSTASLVAAGCTISQQQEVQLGQQEAQQVNAQLPILRDASINRYINDLGRSIARTTSRSDLGWRFGVVNTNAVNAFALPGGYVYVNRGVLQRASNESELAAVLAHEIEHVVRRHSVQQMQQMQGANLGLGLACAFTNICTSQVAQTGINVAGTAVFAKFSRTDEIEADEGGFRNMIRAGINPRGMLTFFDKLYAEEQRGGSRAAVSWFADHPGTRDRMADVRSMLSRVPARTLRSLRTNSRGFESMKRRLALQPTGQRASR
jgi:predicted Zn-dependent protease